MLLMTVSFTFGTPSLKCSPSCGSRLISQFRVLDRMTCDGHSSVTTFDLGTFHVPQQTRHAAVRLTHWNMKYAD
jgi:hypothetical protein